MVEHTACVLPICVCAHHVPYEHHLCRECSPVTSILPLSAVCSPCPHVPFVLPMCPICSPCALRAHHAPCVVACALWTPHPPCVLPMCPTCSPVPRLLPMYLCVLPVCRMSPSPIAAKPRPACISFGKMKNGTGVSANQACCVCGGGDQSMCCTAWSCVLGTG